MSILSNHDKFHCKKPFERDKSEKVIFQVEDWTILQYEKRSGLYIIHGNGFETREMVCSHCGHAAPPKIQAMYRLLTL